MKTAIAVMMATFLVPALCPAEVVAHAIHGTVESVKDTGSAIVVKTAAGTKHTLHAVKTTSVHGFAGASTATTGTFKGVSKGSEVVAHYTTSGAKNTALTLHKVGDSGLKATEGTIQAVDQGAKTIALKTADGSVHTYQMAEHASVSTSKAVAGGVTTGTKAVVYSVENAGSKVAHFIRKI